MEHRKSHAGRTVLVTGAGQGIGRAIALAFAGRGAKVGVLDRNVETAEGVAQKIMVDGGTSAATSADVADYDAMADAISEMQVRLGSAFDTLVNNAGISPKHNGLPHTITEMSPAEWATVIGVNLTGCFNTVRLLSPQMKAAGFGAIVNMSSISGRTYAGIVGVHYSASKAAIIGFTRHIAAELGPFGIRANAIAPGRIETPLVTAAPREVNVAAVRATPMGRLGKPEEVASLALYLTSEESSFITGQICDVAGGWCMT